MTNLRSGAFVTSTESTLGIGKLVDDDGEFSTIEYFDSPVSPNQRLERVSRASVRTVVLPEQTRVYFYDEAARAWKIGRSATRFDVNYRILLPNDRFAEIAEKDLFVRWSKPFTDPTPLLAARITETPWFHEGRARFVAWLTKQRATSGGLAGLLSSVIDLEKHQYEVVKRVLGDPIQRYLLADEVGLGKTIEAGVIIRQYILEHPESHSVLVLVPQQLRCQWEEELRSKFLLDPYLDMDGATVSIVTYGDLDELASYDSLGLLVIDEAHHLASFEASDDDAERLVFETVRDVAATSERLLLLSATPVLNNERAYLAMLHLLDPAVYSLNDLDSFRQRVAQREEIATAFHAFTETNQDFFISSLSDQLAGFFPGDERLQNLVRSLKDCIDSGVDEDDEERVRAIRAVRAHVSETYRLHRRIIRNRRAGDLEALVPGRDGVHVIRYEDPIRNRVEELVDYWRGEVVDSILPGIVEHRQKEVSRFVMLVIEAALGDPLTIADQNRTWSMALGRNELQELGRSFEKLAERTEDIALGDDARIAALIDFVSREMDEGDKALVFCTYEQTADRVYDALRERFRGRIERHRSSIQEDEDEDMEWRRFRNDPACAVLVCDRSAEEGLNLQVSHGVLIHFDLPFDPNRLEQRLGRLDRFGVGSPIRSVVFVPDQSLYSDHWVRCLDQSFRVFDRSIATLQYLVEDQMQQLRHAFLEEGPRAFDSLAERLGGEQGLVETELEATRIQDEFDAVEVLEEEEDDAFDSLEDFDSGWKEHEAAVDGWISRCLQFRKWYVNDRDSTSGTIARYLYQNNTLVSSSELIDRFMPAFDLDASDYRTPQTHTLAFKRETGRRHNTRLARSGEPFIEAMSHYIRWDDRGSCFALWRIAPSAVRAIDGVEIGFRFDFAIEADIERIEVGASTRTTLDAVRFRADCVYPPQIKTIWVDSSMRAIEDDDRLRILTAPYQGGYKDYNLSSRRWLLAGGYVDSATWMELCEAARATAESILRDDPDFAMAMESSIGRVERERDVALAQLESRLSRLDGVELETDRAVLDEERRLRDGLLDSIRQPSIRLDAIGAVLMSNDNPFRGDAGE